MSPTSTVEAVRAGAGLVDLFRPGAVGALELGRAADARERAVYRVLGARQVLQAVITGRTGWTALGAAVDVLHGASMIAVAVAAPARYRRGALLQALVAATFAVAEIRRLPPA